MYFNEHESDLFGGTRVYVMGNIYYNYHFDTYTDTSIGNVSKYHSVIEIDEDNNSANSNIKQRMITCTPY